MNGKRHAALCLAILEEVERNTVITSLPITRPLDAFEGFTEEQVLLHYRLLIEENFLVGSIDPKSNTVRASRMMWKGYDYLDELRRHRAAGLF